MRRGATPAGEILYVTPNGVLEPLGYSQICRVICGLSRAGFRYRLLSLERERDLNDELKRSTVAEQLRRAGVAWTVERYQPGSTGSNLGRLLFRAAAIAKQRRLAMVHARGYQAAAVGWALQRSAGIPYLFDARGRWLDERLLAKPRLRDVPVMQPLARRLERVLYRHAHAIVTLTALHAEDVRAGCFGEHNGRPLEVITTCADYDDFSLRRRREEAPEPLRRLGGSLTLAIVGSMNASYHQREAAQLARSVLQRRPDARLVVLTAQVAAFEQLLRETQLDPQRTLVTAVPNQEMPKWLAGVHWSIQLLTEDISKRASMPTKLAEFFGSGVRTAHFGCNSEVASWVNRAGSGYVLEALSRAELEKAAAFVASSPTSLALLETARRETAEHFDLAAGLARYGALLSGLGMSSAPQGSGALPDAWPRPHRRLEHAE